MELDIQRFLQNSDQQQFGFQHLSTSYLRLAAHHVAQHYGLHTMVQENLFDGLGTRVVVRKLTEGMYPAVSLSEIPAKQLDNSHEQVKIVIKQRPDKASSNEACLMGIKSNTFRTVEERKEEYDRARARIFSMPSCPHSEDISSHNPLYGKDLCLCRDANEVSRCSMVDSEKISSIRHSASTSQVAILKDRDKDRADPDYDQSYERYVKGLPANQSISLAPFNMQKFQPPFTLYDTVIPQVGPIPRTETSLSYGTHVGSLFCNTRYQTSRGDIFMQWPTAAMKHGQSYDQFGHAVFQEHRYFQQPSSFHFFFGDGGNP